MMRTALGALRRVGALGWPQGPREEFACQVRPPPSEAAAPFLGTRGTPMKIRSRKLFSITGLAIGVLLASSAPARAQFVLGNGGINGIGGINGVGGIGGIGGITGGISTIGGIGGISTIGGIGGITGVGLTGVGI